MVLTPAILHMALGQKGFCGDFLWVLRTPAMGIFMLLFVGMLMASRLPTISLKAIRIPRSRLLPVLAMLLLLVAFLVSDFWLTLGVIGSIYILTIPVVCWLFLRGRARYERDRQD
jgi:CDP-diacylglycerol--serine O-phosphatidyltransferase